MSVTTPKRWKYLFWQAKQFRRTLWNVALNTNHHRCIDKIHEGCRSIRDCHPRALENKPPEAAPANFWLFASKTVLTTITTLGSSEQLTTLATSKNTSLTLGLKPNVDLLYAPSAASRSPHPRSLRRPRSDASPRVTVFDLCIRVTVKTT